MSHPLVRDRFEQNAIAIILGLMVLLTFINVVLRYIFNSGIIWGLEAVSFLFAWLVVFGASYCVKRTAHLGVDAIINMASARGKRLMGLITGALCLIYAFFLMKGSWDYWSNYANLPKTTGRWFPTGFKEMKIYDMKGYTPVEDIPMPEFLRFLERWLLIEGDAPLEKLPLVIPYVILPIGSALLLFRFAQAFWAVWKGRQTSLIVSHELDEGEG